MPSWRRWLGRVSLGLIAILALLTLLPLFETDEWWVRLWDFPRIQLAALLAIALAGLVVAGPRHGRAFWIGAAAGLAALGWQLWQVASYIPGWPSELQSAERCPPGRALRLLNANVLMTNRNYGALRALVRRTDPDMLLLLEPNLEWQKAVRPLAAAYPHRIEMPLPNTYGMILLSKLPLQDPQIRNLLQPHVPSFRAAVRLRSGETVEFYGLHPEPPVPGDDSGERDAELVKVGREVREEGRAAIVMGDMNDVGWSHSSRLFRRLSGTKDPRVGRGFYPTYPADLPLLAWPLDHIFVTPHFRLLGIDRLERIGSDHRPMLFSICLARAPGQRLNPPSVPAEIREDASEQVEEGLEERAEENHG